MKHEVLSIQITSKGEKLVAVGNRLFSAKEEIAITRHVLHRLGMIRLIEKYSSIPQLAGFLPSPELQGKRIVVYKSETEGTTLEDEQGELLAQSLEKIDIVLDSILSCLVRFQAGDVPLLVHSITTLIEDKTSREAQANEQFIAVTDER
jgi:hypothetical protein